MVIKIVITNFHIKNYTVVPVIVFIPVIFLAYLKNLYKRQCTNDFFFKQDI